MENTVFWTLARRKLFNRSILNVAGLTTSSSSTNLPNLVRIGCEVAPPRGGDIQRQCAFLVYVSITSSPAGLSCVNGVGPCSANIGNFSPLPKSQFRIDLFQIWRG